MDIKQLVDDSKKGCIDSFIQLLTAKQDMLYKISFTYTGNPYDAEDCLSEASIQAFDKIRQLREPEKFYQWFTTLLINHCRANYRKQQRERERLAKNHEQDLLAGMMPDFSTGVDDQILVEEIFQSLKKDERDLLALKFMEEFTLKEIAAIMGVAEGTVKSRFYRTLAKIKKVWRDEE